MEAGFMDIVRSLNRIWIYDTYFSLYRPVKSSGGEMSGYTSQTTLLDKDVQRRLRCFRHVERMTVDRIPHIALQSISLASSCPVLGLFSTSAFLYSLPYSLSTAIISISLSLHLVLLAPINSCELHNYYY